MHPKVEPIVKQVEREIQCNCDLDNYEPTDMTDHTITCDIHKEALYRYDERIVLEESVHPYLGKVSSYMYINESAFQKHLETLRKG